MSAPYSCFEKIIGLADTSCDCFTGDIPAGASESASGLQLADLEGLNLETIKRAANCATGGDTGALLQKAVDEGVKRYKEEVLRYVRANARVRRPSVRSQVGDNANSRTEVTLSNTYHGMNVMLAHMVGGTCRVKRIGTYMDFTGSIDVDVFGLDATTPEDTVTCATTQGVLTWTDANIDLSMQVEGSRNPEYWFLWQPTGGQKALNCRIHCGCGGRRRFNETPWFESGVKANDEAWMQWAMAGGVRGDTLSERED